MINYIAALPDQPRRVRVENSEATSINLSWELPFAIHSPILYYMIYAHNRNKTTERNDLESIAAVNTSTNTTSFNVSGLLPGTTYELTVMAIYQGRENITTRQAAPSLNNSVVTTTRSTG